MSIITRAEAKKLGLKSYFTGNPCQKGHIATRRVSNANCQKCLQIKQGKRRQLLSDEEKERRLQARLETEKDLIK